MGKTLWASMLALLAACKPGQKITTGIFHTEKEKMDYKRSDSIILWREKAEHYAIWKKTAVDYHDPLKKDTAHVKYSRGVRIPNSNVIIEDSTHARLRYNHEKRILRSGGRKYRRIGS